MAAYPRASELAARMLADYERDAADPENMHRRRAALQEQVDAWEAAYGIRSADVHAAIDDGRLEETWEVCQWIFADEILRWPGE